MRADAACMSDGQWENALTILVSDIEELAGLPNGYGIYALAIVHNLSDFYHNFNSILFENFHYLISIQTFYFCLTFD